MSSGAPTSLILEPAMASMALVNAGTKKVRLPLYKMGILGMLAGFYIALGGQVSFAIQNGFTTVTGATSYLSGIGFSFGLMMIIIAGAELFTGNCLIIMAVLASRISWRDMLWDWFVVYFANFFGTIVFAVIIWASGVNGGAANEDLSGTGKVVCKVALGKANLFAHEPFFRGIIANVCVCLAVISAAASKSAIGKVFVIALPIGAFVACSFDHSIANMYTFSMATLLRCGDHGWYWLNLLMCTIGNVVGALILGVSYWATMVVGSEDELPCPCAPVSEPVALAVAAPAAAQDDDESRQATPQAIPLRAE